MVGALPYNYTFLIGKSFSLEEFTGVARDKVKDYGWCRATELGDNGDKTLVTHFPDMRVALDAIFMNNETFDNKLTLVVYDGERKKLMNELQKLGDKMYEIRNSPVGHDRGPMNTDLEIREYMPPEPETAYSGVVAADKSLEIVAD